MNVPRRRAAIIALALLLLALLPLTTSASAVSTVSPSAPTVVEGSSRPELQAGGPLDIALEHLRASASRFGLRESDLADYRVTDNYRSRRSGTTHVYLVQRHSGIDVWEATANVNVARDGSVLNSHVDFVPNVARSANVTEPAITPEVAVQAAASTLGLSIREPLTEKRAPTGSDRTTILSDGGISFNDIPARLVYLKTEAGILRLTWLVEIYTLDQLHYWQIHVDAETGVVLAVRDLVVHEDFDLHARGVTAPPARQATPLRAGLPDWTGFGQGASAPLSPDSYLVYAMPMQDPTDGPQVTVTNPHLAAVNASPQGWHDLADVQTTQTHGNNTLTYEDRTAAGAGAPAPSTTPLGRDFIYPIPGGNPDAVPPEVYMPASITNLFYWNNINHDVHYQYGFDEPSGNFQFDTYGRGGAGNDGVLAEAQDGSGVNNANMLTLPDGLPGRMQMYLGTNRIPFRDGSLDNAVIIHEYGHGVSTRLTGGPSTNCLSGDEQGGEGWSDWWGMTLTAKPEHTGATARPMGTWLFGQPPDGPGIRPYPYSTDFSINPMTYDSIKAEGLSVPHGVGSVWATIIWEMYWELVENHGFNPDFYAADATQGNIIAMNIVMEGLKLHGCEPTFVDARNGILLAEQTLYGGQYHCELAEAFARRGLGYSANDGGTSDLTDGTEAFDLPSGPDDPNPPAQWPLDVDCRPDFELSVQPDGADVCVGEAALFSVAALNPEPAFTGPVSLAVPNAPAGTTPSFNTPVLTTIPATATLTIDTTGATARGTHYFDIVGTGGASTVEATARLHIEETTPTAPTLTSPVSGVEVGSQSPAFIWEAVPGAASYRLEIATDGGFNDIIIVHDNLRTNSLNLPEALPFGGTYFWRVWAINGCGQSAQPSQTFTFTTANVICEVYEPTIILPTPIESGIPNGYTVTVPDPGIVADVNVLNLKGTHSYFSDLTFELTSPEGTIVTLMEPTCGDTDNFDLNLDDEAAPGLWPCPPVDGGTYKPTEPLYTFDGENRQGDWTLTIRDSILPDFGMLEDWDLEICVNAAVPTAVVLNDVNAASTVPSPALAAVGLLGAVGILGLLRRRATLSRGQQ